MRKRRRIEEEEEEDEEEMEEGNMSVISSDLPPGRQEHQELKEHTILTIPSIPREKDTADWK